MCAPENPVDGADSASERRSSLRADCDLAASVSSDPKGDARDARAFSIGEGGIGLVLNSSDAIRA